MTGPEHYTSAEQWLYKAQNEDARGGLETAESCAAIAQVHATLALAAATALGTDQPQRDRVAWYAAAGAKPPKDDA
jgi:hypothetical protein